MKESTRMEPFRVQGKQIAKEIVMAIDNERKKREWSQRRLSEEMGNPRPVWREIMKRGSGQLVSIIRACEALDIEIVLVDREGSSLT